MIETIYRIALILLFIIGYFYLRRILKKEYFLKNSKNKRKFFLLPIIYPRKFFKKEDLRGLYAIYILHIIYFILAIWLIIEFISNM